MRTSGQQRQQKKQRLEGIGRHQLGTAKGDFTDDIYNIRRSIANYAAPVWSTNASESNIGKIQRAQNEALRSITGSRKMSSIDHLHSETKMLQVEDHLTLVSAQYLVQCLDTENVWRQITKMDLLPREMKETIFTRHYQTVLPLLANNRKDTLQTS